VAVAEAERDDGRGKEQEMRKQRRSKVLLSIVHWPTSRAAKEEADKERRRVRVTMWSMKRANLTQRVTQWKVMPGARRVTQWRGRGMTGKKAKKQMKKGTKIASQWVTQ
jgi:hypothetical protein